MQMLILSLYFTTFCTCAYIKAPNLYLVVHTYVRTRILKNCITIIANKDIMIIANIALEYLKWCLVRVNAIITVLKNLWIVDAYLLCVCNPIVQYVTIFCHIFSKTYEDFQK